MKSSIKNDDKYILYSPFDANQIIIENTLEEILFFTSANCIKEGIIKPYHIKCDDDKIAK